MIQDCPQVAHLSVEYPVDFSPYPPHSAGMGKKEHKRDLGHDEHKRRYTE